MKQLEKIKNIGIDPETFNVIDAVDQEQVIIYENQLKETMVRQFGKYLSKSNLEKVEQSGVYNLVAGIVTETAAILGMKKYPNLGLLNGFTIGLPNYQGYCWEDTEKNIWVGLDENWFGDVCENIYRFPFVSEAVKKQILLVMAEEVFHAYIREVNPALTKESEQSTLSGDLTEYLSNPGEQAAKEFAQWYFSEDYLPKT